MGMLCWVGEGDQTMYLLVSERRNQSCKSGLWVRISARHRTEHPVEVACNELALLSNKMVESEFPNFCSFFPPFISTAF